MKLINPIKATTIKRYKRFFVDVRLEDGRIVTAHCPNTGPMTGCFGENWPCILTESDNPKRKLKYTMHLTFDNTYIITNTHLPNTLVHEALLNKELPSLEDYELLAKEVSFDSSRFDFLLSKGKKKTIIEVKSASSLTPEGLSFFPDTVSTRALKHLKELITLQDEGYGCVLLFFIAREDANFFTPASEDIMPGYLAACREAQRKGVELKAFQWSVSPQELKFKREIPVIL